MNITRGEQKCAIGPHVIAHGTAAFGIENVYVCHPHAMGIANEFDSTLGRPMYQRASEAEHKRVKRARQVDREETAARILRGREPGFVYYIKIDDLVKIGFTHDVTKRMRAYPPSAVLLAVHPGTLETEKEMYQKFHVYLARGREWFTPGKKLMQHTQVVKGRFGDPSALAYKYSRAA